MVIWFRSVSHNHHKLSRLSLTDSLEGVLIFGKVPPKFFLKRLYRSVQNKGCSKGALTINSRLIAMHFQQVLHCHHSERVCCKRHFITIIFALILICVDCFCRHARPDHVQPLLTWSELAVRTSHKKSSTRTRHSHNDLQEWFSILY